MAIPTLGSDSVSPSPGRGQVAKIREQFQKELDASKKETVKKAARISSGKLPATEAPPEEQQKKIFKANAQPNSQGKMPPQILAPKPKMNTRSEFPPKIAAKPSKKVLDEMRQQEGVRTPQKPPIAVKPKREGAVPAKLQPALGKTREAVGPLKQTQPATPQAKRERTQLTGKIQKDDIKGISPPKYLPPKSSRSAMPVVRAAPQSAQTFPPEKDTRGLSAPIAVTSAASSDNPIREEGADQDFFQYAEKQDLEKIKRVVQNKPGTVKSFAKCIKAGQWEIFISKMREDPIQHRAAIFGALYDKQIDSLELMTALMFWDAISILEKGDTWEIKPYPLVSVSENQKYCLQITFQKKDHVSVKEKIGFSPDLRPNRFSPQAFAYKDGSLIVPSASGLQEYYRNASGQKDLKIFPVMQLSDPEKMLENLGENKHDFAVFLDGGQVSIHGFEAERLTTYLHDDFHLRYRLLYTRSQYKDMIIMAKNLYHFEKSLPPYEQEIERNSSGFIEIDSTKSKKDLKHILIEYLIGRIIDGSNEFINPPSFDAVHPEAYYKWMIDRSFDSNFSELASDFLLREVEGEDPRNYFPVEEIKKECLQEFMAFMKKNRLK